MTSNADSLTPRHQSEYNGSYNESLRSLKDGILLEGRLSGRELQRCLLYNGVPVQDCPSPDQLLQRLGLASIPQPDTPTGTLDRKNKKRFSSKIKVSKPKIFKSRGDKVLSYMISNRYLFIFVFVCQVVDTQDTADLVVIQLLHSSLQLMYLEATNQTSVHAPISSHNTSPSFSPGDEMEDTLKKLNQTQTDILAWSEREDRDRRTQELESLRKELGEVKRARDELEFRYSEMREK